MLNRYKGSEALIVITYKLMLLMLKQVMKTTEGPAMKGFVSKRV